MKRTLVVVAVMIMVASITSGCCGWTVGTRRVISRSPEVMGFDSLSFSAVGELNISQGDAESLEITAEENIMRRLVTRVEGDTLTIEMERGGWLNVGSIPTEAVTFDLVVRDLRQLDVAGLGAVSAEGLEGDQLSLRLSGAGGIDLDGLDVGHLDVVISGLGMVRVAGRANTQDIDLTSAGGYDGADLASDSATVDLSGLGTATVWVQESLDIRIDGAGNVRYYGSPSVTEEISGLGKVTSLGERE